MLRRSHPREAAGRSGCGGAKLRHSWSLVGFGEEQEMCGVELYAAVRLAVVDELGYVPLSQTGSELLFDVFSRRYENAPPS